jgi:hypothetical protein
MVDITEALKKVADAASIPIADVQAEVSKLKAEGYTDEQALVLYKTSNTIKNRLTGRILESAILVPYRVGRERRVESIGKRVADVSLFLKDNEQWDARDLTLWEESIDKYLSQFKVGQPVTCKVKVKDDGKLNLLGDVTTSTEPVTLASLIEKIGTISLSEVGNYAGMNAFVKGIVGRVFTTEYGGGVEISDIESLAPVTVYVDSVDGIKAGDSVTAVGFVKQKNGKTYINGSLV